MNWRKALATRIVSERKTVKLVTFTAQLTGDVLSSPSACSIKVISIPPNIE